MYEALEQKDAEVLGAPSDAPWAQQQRLEFIDFRLRWEGRLNRSDLMEFFGISTPRASMDIGAYLALRPNNAKYDRTSRAYLAQPAFEPLFSSQEHNLSYLNELLAVRTGALSSSRSRVGTGLSVGFAPTVGRTPCPDVLAAVLRAIRQQRAVRVSYQSGEHPEDLVIAPHALAHVGGRWLLRAHREMGGDYVNFVLTRILAIEVLSCSGCDGQQDSAWHESLTLVLEPSPELSATARTLVEMDYGMSAGRALVECQRALLSETMAALAGGADSLVTVRVGTDA